jgi:dolichol-phosphate mannosyltransferase
MKLAIVIPTYNEAENIVNLIADLRASIGKDSLIIIVDDASPDGTSRIVRSLGDNRVLVVDRAAKQGLGSAYRLGFGHALHHGADYIVQMDADLSHDPVSLHEFLKHHPFADLVIGSRYVRGGKIEGWGPWRHFCSRSAMGFSRAVLGLEVRDVTSGYRLWNAQLLSRILFDDLVSNGYAFQEEMVYRAQLLDARIVEVPITFRDRQLGRSKLHWRDVYEFFEVMARLRFRL